MKWSYAFSFKSVRTMIFVKHVYILTLFLFNIIESFQKIYKSIFKKKSKNILFICLSFYADKYIIKHICIV